MRGCRVKRWLPGLLAGALAAAGLHAGAGPVDLVCPCAIDRDGDTATVTFGVRNVATDAGTGALRVQVVMLATEDEQPAAYVWGEASLGASVAAGASLAAASYTLESGYYVPPGAHETRILLLDGNHRLDSVWMEQPVDAGRDAFRVQNEDFLADVDGDGVGDRNEGIAGTDPADANSTPGEATVDVLVLYNSAFADLYNGDPSGRILHVFTLTNEIFRRSDAGVRFRVVGFVETELRGDWHQFAEPARAFVKPLEEAHGADVVVFFRPFVIGGAICGWASAPTAYRGRIRFAESGGFSRNFATVFGDCGGQTTAHELGHVLGLGHSLRQQEEGTFRWSRGHYVHPHDELAISVAPGTTMTYGQTYLDRFASPDARCGDVPCGVAAGGVDGADAVRSLRVTRYQVATHRPAPPDRDGDGFVAALDDDDGDPNIWRDHDGDGTNDDEDKDDDNDGVPDEDDAFPRDARDWADADGDGVGDNTDAFPRDASETVDADGDGIGDNANREVPLFVADGHPQGRQGFVRIINRSDAAGQVRIRAFDDDGEMRATSAPIRGRQTLHFNSTHLEAGDAGRQIAGIGDGAGDWRLVLTSTLDLEVLAYVRAQGGFLTSIHDTAPRLDGAWRVYFFNPARNDQQRSLLRLANPNPTPVDVTITGTDDNGSRRGPVRLTVPARAARTVNAEQLESGSGVTGALGAGAGKWRLRVAASGALRVMSLMESPTGHLSNLSTAPDLTLPHAQSGDHDHVLLFPSAADERRQGFVRVINRDILPNLMNVFAYDGGPVRNSTFTVPVGGVAHFNSTHLREGKPSIGLEGVGATESGPWWLTVLGSEAMHPLAYIRTREGFVTAMHDMAPVTLYEQRGGAGRHEVVTFNPASNQERRSLLRLVSTGAGPVGVVITGIDDAGASPGTTMRALLPAGSARLLSAAALESGNADGFSGALGDGQGKWRLVVEADAPLAVMSLLENTNTGLLTNLSTGTAERPRWEATPWPDASGGRTVTAVR